MNGSLEDSMTALLATALEAVVNELEAWHHEQGRPLNYVRLAMVNQARALVGKARAKPDSSVSDFGDGMVVASYHLARALGPPPDSNLKESDYATRKEFVFVCVLDWGRFLFSEADRNFRADEAWINADPLAHRKPATATEGA